MKIKTLGTLAAIAAVAIAFTADHSEAANFRTQRYRERVLRTALVKYAVSKLGTKVDQGQGGQCTELVTAALQSAGGVGGKFDTTPYVWGRLWTGSNIPGRGTIVQFEGVVFQGGGWTWNFPHHTAIVESVNGTQVTLLHQNVDGSLAASQVRRQTIDFATKTSGTYTIYVPRPSSRPRHFAQN